MIDTNLDVVTGAFSFTGRYVTKRLLAAGRRVVTLTGKPERDNPFGPSVSPRPFHFDDPAALTAALSGASTLYNTYWIRFERGEMTFRRALANTEALLRAARTAGIRRLVHFSALRAEPTSQFHFYRAKGEAERLVRESGLSYAILRPTLLFGRESLFLNNIAWMLRHYPVFAIPGKHGGRLQPICVEDVAELAVCAGGQQENLVQEAAGPETFTFEEMVRLIARKIGSHAHFLHFKPERTLQLSRLIGERVGDVVLTEDEITGLLQGLLVAEAPPSGHTRFSDWLPAHAADLGRTYLSEIERHFRSE